jgi:hypothetical protein
MYSVLAASDGGFKVLMLSGRSSGKFWESNQAWSGCGTTQSHQYLAYPCSFLEHFQVADRAFAAFSKSSQFVGFVLHIFSTATQRNCNAAFVHAGNAGFSHLASIALSR